MPRIMLERSGIVKSYFGKLAESARYPRPIPPTPKKVYTPRLPPGAKSVTVAAGIVCHNGVVLGADTEVTFGYTGKRNESKILPIKRELGCYLTFAGHVSFAREFADRLREKAKAEHDPRQILAAAKQQYHEMFDLQCTREPNERAYASILITVREDVREPFKAKIYDYRTSLFHISEDHCFQVPNYAVIGIGEELATAIFEPLCLSLSVRETIYTLVYAIHKVKRAVQGVGGTTEIVEILNNGELPFSDFGKQEIKEIEEEFDFLESQFNPVLIAFPSEMHPTNFLATMRRFNKAVKERRRSRYQLAKQGRSKPKAPSRS